MGPSILQYLEVLLKLGDGLRDGADSLGQGPPRGVLGLIPLELLDVGVGGHVLDQHFPRGVAVAAAGCLHLKQLPPDLVDHRLQHGVDLHQVI